MIGLAIHRVILAAGGEKRKGRSRERETSCCGYSGGDDGDGGSPEKWLNYFTF